jgi:hypothetical protein
MTTEADQAIANEISLEVKKDGLSQRQSGDWSLRFTVAAIDMDRRLTEAAMGARFQCVLVEVNDDETPVDHKSQERDKWREMGATKQAGIRCNDPVFWSFLREYLHYAVNDMESAAKAVRDWCAVESRADFDKPGKSFERQRWLALDYNFQAWKAAEHA